MKKLAGHVLKECSVSLMGQWFYGGNGGECRRRNRPFWCVRSGSPVGGSKVPSTFVLEAFLFHLGEFVPKLVEVGFGVEVAEVVHEAAFFFFPCSPGEFAEEFVALRDADEEVEVVSHGSVGEDFDAGEAFHAAHEFAEGFLFDVAKEEVAAGRAGHNVMAAGPIWKGKSPPLPASPSGLFEGDAAEHFPRFAIGFLKVGEWWFFFWLRHLAELLGKKKRLVNYCLPGTLVSRSHPEAL